MSLALQRPLLCVALLLPFICLASASGAPAKDPGNGDGALRVMSFNIRYGTAPDGENHWEKRRELLFDNITRFDPDLLGVQEAIADQIDELQQKLPEHEFIGVGRDDGKRKGEFSGIYFRKDRFEQIDGGHFWLSPTPDQPGSKGWDAAITRMATWVRLRDQQRPDAEPLLVLNTHWDHMGAEARLESAKLIRSKLRELHPKGPAIVMGDMNAREDDPPYAEIVREAEGGKLIDSYRSAHPNRQTDEATYHGFQGGRAGSRIDFIFHTPDLKTLEAAIDRTEKEGRYPSDHYAVTAVLTAAGEGR